MSNFTVRVVVDDGSGTTSKTSSTKKGKTPSKTAISKSDKIISSSTKNAIALAGTALSLGSVINGTVGNYTEDRIRQRRVSRGLTTGGYVIATVINPVALIGIGIIEYKRALDFQINNEKKNMKSQYLRTLSGNTTESGNRWRGAR